MATVLFVCLQNAGRSQMSQALFERATAGRHAALSAGTTPADRVHPEVVEVMREVGIDLSDRRPRRLATELAESADVVVTMGCGDECPYIPGKRYVDWALPDPRGRAIEEVRAIRDDIDERVRALARELEPLTCSLGPGDLRDRERQLAQTGRAGLLTSELSGTRAVLQWDRAVRDDVRALMAAEAECCPFLDIRFVERGDSIELVVEAPPGAEAVLADLVGAIGAARA